MGWQNSDLSWNELERTLNAPTRPVRAERPTSAEPPIRRTDPGPLSRHRPPATPPPRPRPDDAVPYAELHAHSSYSFLDGASSPDELLAEAERLGLTALAITDHDGFYGAARFAEVAELTGVQTVFGAELSLGNGSAGPAPARGGVPDPDSEHLLVLARGVEGYRRLSWAITQAQLRGGEKGRPQYDLDELAASAGGHWTILTGCRKGAVRRGLTLGDARTPLRRLVDLFGADQVAVELIDHGDPQDSGRNDTLAGLAADLRLPVVATG
ncbi:MAG: PHP domain-containing protein, partial [Microbacterium sp.]